LGALGAAALIALGTLVASPALAQTSAQCRALGTDDERIACLEARIDALEEALARQDATDEVEAPAAEAVSPAPTPVVPDATASFGAEQLDAAPVAAAATAPAEPAAREGRRWLRMPGIPFIGRDRDEEPDAAPTAVAAAPPLPAATPSAPPAGVEGFGAEQVAARAGTRDLNPRDEEDEILRAKIVDFEELHRGRLVVALDNGQIWRQLDVDSRTVRLRAEESYDVEIWRSGFGGYRMRVADNARVMSVERLR
jgi:hypothetical protein